MAWKEISDEYDQVGWDDEKQSNNKKELKFEKRPKEDQQWHHAEKRKVERSPFEAPIQCDQVVSRPNEFILGVRHEPSPRVNLVSRAEARKQTKSWNPHSLMAIIGLFAIAFPLERTAEHPHLHVLVA